MAVWTFRLGIRSRIMLIALVPSIALAAIGAGTALTLIGNAQHAKHYAQSLAGSAGSNTAINAAFEQERMLSIWNLTSAEPDQQALTAARTSVDQLMRGLSATLEDARGSTAGMNSELGNFFSAMRALPSIRTETDARTIGVQQVYEFYSNMLGGTDRDAEQIVAAFAPDAASAARLEGSLRLYRTLEAMSRSSALLAAPVNGQALPPDLASELRDLVGYYRMEFGKLVSSGVLDAQRVGAITNGTAWRTVTDTADAVLTSSTGTAAAQRLTVSPRAWRDAATEVGNQLLALFDIEFRSGEQDIAAKAAHTEHTGFLAGGALLAITLLAFLISLALASRFSGRLHRLRREILVLADESLPEATRALRSGEPVSDETRTARLDFGSDEIGQVADAFNRAHTTAVEAAITQARTREGVRRVFLAIARRFQLVIQKQLGVLDEAEARQEDPALLRTFFELDHLATRARRNAENLIILAGARPARQWRHPVALIDLCHSAVSEAVDYTRVHLGAMPQARVVGGAVADLVHLLAELIDNAAFFSPPHMRVELTAGLVGHGLVIQVEDRGVGMTGEALQNYNRMLSEPPDFDLTDVGTDSRLGLFVVARLAVRNGLSVRLHETDYGGISALVLVPTTSLASDDRRDTGTHRPRGDVRIASTDRYTKPGAVRASGAIRSEAPGDQ